MIRIIFLCTILLNWAYAQDISIRFCPSKRATVKLAYKDAAFLQTAEDKVRIDGTCVDVKTVQDREQLYIKFLQNKYPQISVNSSADPYNNPQCRLEIIKKIDTEKEETKVANKGVELSVSASELIGKAGFVSQLVTFSGQDTKIQFDQEFMTVNCRVTKAGFNISLSSSSPYLSLQNQFFLPPNQFKWVGSVRSNKKEKNKKIQIIKNQALTEEKKIAGEIFIRARK